MFSACRPSYGHAVRVVIAGMGSAIGTAVARILEANKAVDEILGFDLEPPRRWLQRAEFHFCRPEDTARVVRLVTEFAPTVVVHCWVFEPRARSSPGQARARTVAGTESLLNAIEAASPEAAIERLVVRSSASLFGHRAAAPSDVPRPTTTFGRMVQRVERRSTEVGEAVGATVVPVRLAAVTSSSLPNPLGRYLRLPVVPVPINGHKFAVIHLEDAATVIAAAATSRCSGPINAVAADPVTAMEAVMIGGRVPLPVLPIALRLGRTIAELAGTPMPEHVAELLTRCQPMTPTDLTERLGITLRYRTPEVLEDLYSLGRLVEVESLGSPYIDVEAPG